MAVICACGSQPSAPRIQRRLPPLPRLRHALAWKAVFHLPKEFTFTALWAASEDAAAHSRRADMVISRLIMMATGRAMACTVIGRGGDVASRTRAVATITLSATATQRRSVGHATCKGPRTDMQRTRHIDTDFGWASPASEHTARSPGSRKAPNWETSPSILASCPSAQSVRDASMKVVAARNEFHSRRLRAGEGRRPHRMRQLGCTPG